MLTWKDDTLLADGATVGGLFGGSTGTGKQGWSWWVASMSRAPTHNASNGGEWHGTRAEAKAAADAFCAKHPERFVRPLMEVSDGK